MRLVGARRSRRSEVLALLPPPGRGMRPDVRQALWPVARLANLSRLQAAKWRVGVTSKAAAAQGPNPHPKLPAARRKEPSQGRLARAAKVMSLVQCWAMLCAGSVVAQTARISPSNSRSAELSSCLPGELATWPDGQDRPAPGGAVRLAYRHASAPASLPEPAVVAALQRAAAAWSACGVPGQVISDAAVGLQPASEVQVAWDDSATRGNFALADLGRRRLWLSAAMFALLAQRNPRHPAQQTLQMAISHEMGHFFGLMAHSRRCVDVMSYYRYGPAGATCSTRDGNPYTALPEYRALLPTACDIARCRAVNGRP